MRRARTLVVALLFVAVGAGAARAHRPSDSYLRLRLDGALVDGRWDIALRDLEDALGLDADGDAAVTGRELAVRQADIAAYALARLTLSADGAPCPLALRESLLAEHSDGAYAVVRFNAACPRPPRTLTVDDQLLYDLDPQHRGLATLSLPGKTVATVFRADGRRLAFDATGLSPRRELAMFIEEGVLHIWAGLDHILFLLALLLPSVLRRRDAGWQAAGRFREVTGDVLKVVTAFTVAHSLTLALSVLGIVQLPARFVETAIALTVVLAALNNVFPVARGRWTMAFSLGLLHGFGFSSVLLDLGVGGARLATTLVGFNLGVELGQAAIVAVFLPLAFVVRHTWVYQRLCLFAGSVAIVILASVWSVERFMS